MDEVSPSFLGKACFGYSVLPCLNLFFQSFSVGSSMLPRDSSIADKVPGSARRRGPNRKRINYPAASGRGIKNTIIKRERRVEIGIDIIEIDRIAHMLEKYPNFRYRIFTQREVSYCEKKKYPPQHYAARFAAKESIMKTLGTGWSESVRWKDLEITEGPSGKPCVRLHDRASAVSKQQGVKEVKVSLSHCKLYAVAVAQLIKD
jgi:holo-[acyl-carrier protein] synthase